MIYSTGGRENIGLNDLDLSKDRKETRCLKSVFCVATVVLYSTKKDWFVVILH